MPATVRHEAPQAHAVGGDGAIGEPCRSRESAREPRDGRPAGQRPRDDRDGIAAAVNLGAEVDGVSAAQAVLLGDACQQLLPLIGLDRDRAQRAAAVQAEQLDDRPAAEAAVGVVEDYNPTGCDTP